MRPPGKAAIQYSLARIDVIEFERLCGRSVEAVRSRLGYFERARSSLSSLLRAGSAPGDYVSNMLPYRYRAGEEFEDLLSEAHANADAFGQAEGFRPVILVDTSGAVGELLPYIRLSLKRMLYPMGLTHLFGCSRDQAKEAVPKQREHRARLAAKKRRTEDVAAAISGSDTVSVMAADAADWIRCLKYLKDAVALQEVQISPAAEDECEARMWKWSWATVINPSGVAKEWFDRLRPLRKSANLLGGLQTVLQQQDADMIYVISSGLPRRDHADYILSEVRAANAKGVPINVVGIDCDDKGEYGLRELARQHGGTFRHKRFSGPDPDVFREKAQPEAPRVEDTRLSIGGQMDILDIMAKDRRRCSWRTGSRSRSARTACCC
ncbi:unnamed protein product [Prorocentrum cordatum]|uniref:Uncharacterized protein n=1 Tax=Prorocentrum cordatum TaxID=2364126 RepID=A0ABN9WIN1_9DINO|nr:unnamed protein product [Polarella glacialis]